MSRFFLHGDVVRTTCEYPGTRTSLLPEEKVLDRSEADEVVLRD